MRATERLYLDNAATSFPKPPGVADAMARFARELGASPGRGAYAESRSASEILDTCRQRVCDLLGVGAPERVIFTLNATDALNLAIKGVVHAAMRERPGEPVHALTTAMDHNSVLRPLNELAALHHRFSWTCVGADGETGSVDPNAVAASIRRETALVAVNHASNVTGTVQELGAIARACRAAGVPLLVDAAQSAGHLAIDMEALGVELLAAPGHKGLLGPLGTGVLCLGPRIERRMTSLREGGTGSRSELDIQPTELPDRFEPGSHNTIGIAGLSEGVAHLLGAGIDAVRAHEVGLIHRLLDTLPGLEASGYRLVGPTNPERRVAVFSFSHEAVAPDELAHRLEQEIGVLTRSGLHCAPRAHAAMGTSPDGTVRLSFGLFNTVADVDRAVGALQIAAAGAEVRTAGSARLPSVPRGA